MVSTSVAILCYLKKETNTNSEGSIYLRITLMGNRLEFSCKRKWSSKKWNSHSGRALGTNEDAKILNHYLDTMERQVHQSHLELLQQGKDVTLENLKALLKGTPVKSHMLLEIFKLHNEEMKALVGKDYAPLTYKRYQTTLDHTRSFLMWKYKMADLDISKLNYDFITSFEFYLKTVRHCGHNTTIKYLTNFKKIILICVKKNYLTKDPFAGFKMAVKEITKPYLTQEELHRLSEKHFDIERLSIVRDIFLFSCYTGLAYVDVYYLKRNEISKGIDGEPWIFIHRQKTKTPVRIPLLPFAKKLIEKYSDHPKCENENRVFPVWSNQKMNAYLKEIADLCTIQKNLTYHVARHTFATTVTLSNGVPLESVAKLLGHKSLRMTQHYAKIVDQKLSDDMKRLRQKIQ